MNRARCDLLTWTKERLDQIERAPRMWGQTGEAIEFQYLQLLEMRFCSHAAAEEHDPQRFVLDAYATFLRHHFPSQPSWPLHQLCPDRVESSGHFMSVLSSFRRQIEQQAEPDLPYAAHDLVLHLTYKPSVRPTASSLTSYVSTFRQAARAATRRPGVRTGRVNKEFEQSTDFALDDIDIRQPNGSPAEAWVYLSRPAVPPPSPTLDVPFLDPSAIPLTRPQPGLVRPTNEVTPKVEEILGKFMALAEWASLEDRDEPLPLPVVDRTQLALQASRLVPRGPLARVELGGRLVQRYTPVVLRPEDAERLMQAAARDLTPEDFDHTDEIRAIDLDAGEIQLKSGPRQRISCYLPPHLTSDFHQVGVRARVRGQLYQPLMGSPFVLVSEAEVLGGESTQET